MTTQEILQQCTVDGLIVRLPDIQLERDEYLQVKKKLELIGGKWKGGKTQGFVFEQDPTELLADVSNGDDRNLKKEFQFFATPVEVAKIMLEKLPEPLSPNYEEKILEPSAGDGALIQALFDYIGRDVHVDCFEAMELNRKKLSRIEGVNILGDDFLKIDVASNENYLNHYDIILANPPFTKNQDIDHIRKMFEVCKPGGIIITLSSPSWTFGSQKKQVEFREWLDELNAEKIEVDEGAFKDSGTTIRTILLVIKKPVVEEKASPAIETLPSKYDLTESPALKVNPQQKYFSDDELAEFKINIEKKLAASTKELEYLKSFTAVESDATKVAAPGVTDPINYFEKEQLQQMIKRQENFIGNLYEALARIETKTYGICRITGKLIDKARLLAVPHATLSLEAKLGLDKQTQDGATAAAEEFIHKKSNKKEKAIKVTYKDRNKEKLPEGVIEAPHYSADDLRNFKTLISNKIDSIGEHIKYLKSVYADVCKNIKIEGFEDAKPADIEQLIHEQNEMTDKLRLALEKIKSKTYGVDINTKTLIPKSILLKFPTIETYTRRCRVCGCTEDDCSQCIEKTGKPCSWVEEDLCSACKEKEMNAQGLVQTGALIDDQPTSAIEDIEPLEEVNEPVSSSVSDEPLIIKTDSPIELTEGEKRHLQELENNLPSNDNDMNFFQQLAQAGAQNVDITLRIMQKDNKLTVGIMPGVKSATLKPVNVTGTPAELDAEFFKSIMPGVRDIKGVVTNLEKVKREVEKKKDEPPATAKTSGSHKPSPKKPEKKAGIKKASKVEKKKPEVKEEKVVDAEPNMFG